MVRQCFQVPPFPKQDKKVPFDLTPGSLRLTKTDNDRAQSYCQQRPIISVEMQTTWSLVFLSDILKILRAKFTQCFLPQTEIIKLRLPDNNILSRIKPLQRFLIADFAYNSERIL